jgi:prepilin peptidase CpaA
MQDFNASIEPLVRLFGQPRFTVLAVLLVVAAVIDGRTFRVPNWLTVGGMVAGLILNTALPMQTGILSALAGLATGLVILLPLYAVGVMGAGDVKLMAAVGAFLGLPEILFAVLGSLIAGGIAAVAFGLYRRAFGRMTGNVVEIVQSMAFAVIAGHRPTSVMAGRTSVGNLPYGISIAAGTLGWLVFSQLSYA